MESNFPNPVFDKVYVLIRGVCCSKEVLEIKLPTIRTDGKAEVERVREEMVKACKSRGGKSRRKKVREEKESEERRCRCAKR